MAGPDPIAFGKLPKRSDSRTLSLSLPGLLTGKVAPDKEDVHHDTAVQRWGVLGNDTRKDCALAAAGHAEMLWAVLYGEPFPDPTQDQIIDAYSKITGYKPDDPDTDKGADLLTVLKYWQSTGIAGQKIRAFAEVIPHDLNTLKWTIASFGVAYVGLQLPSAWVAPKRESDKKNFATRRHLLAPVTWQNPVNGHCVIYTGYSKDDEFTCVSWGATMMVSRAFHLDYCDEAYAIIPPEPVDGIAEAAKLKELGKEDPAREALSRRAPAEALSHGMEPQHQQLTGQEQRLEQTLETRQNLKDALGRFQDLTGAVELAKQMPAH